MTHFILCCNFPTGGLIFDFTLQHLDAGNFFISLEIFSGLDVTYYLTIYILSIDLDPTRSLGLGLYWVGK